MVKYLHILLLVVCKIVKGFYINHCWWFVRVEIVYIYYCW